MKKYMIGFVIILSVLVGQDRYQFYLNSDDNLKLAGEENYKIIKTELDKMLADYVSKIDITHIRKDFWKIESVKTDDIVEKINLNDYKYACRYCGRPYNGRGYTTAMRVVNRVDDENSALNSYCTRKCARECIMHDCFTWPDAKVWTEWKTGTESHNVVKNRIIERGETMSTIEANWSDVVAFYGGYAELSKVGISKDDRSKFDLDIILEKIELTSPSTCLVHVKINGGNDALKFHKIPKSTYKYEGTYKIYYDNDYLTLYDGGDIWGYFFANPVSFSGHQYHPLKEKFDKKEYIPAFEEIIVLNKSLLLPSTTNYRNAIVTMLDDFVPITDENDPYFLKVKEEAACSEYHELLETRFNGNVKKYKKAKKKEELLRSIPMWYAPYYLPPILELIKKYGFDPSEKCN